MRTDAYEISRTQGSYINRPEAPCSESNLKLEYHDCVSNFLEKQVGCRLPWNKHSPNKEKVTCETRNQVNDLMYVLHNGIVTLAK